MDLPPAGDHGSDRYDYVEISAPGGMRPIGQWWDDLIAAPCPDCRANIFAVGIPNADGLIVNTERPCWAVTIAHDEPCPNPDVAGQ
jgi:hypothetical protein